MAWGKKLPHHSIVFLRSVKKRKSWENYMCGDMFSLAPDKVHFEGTGKPTDVTVEVARSSTTW